MPERASPFEAGLVSVVVPCHNKAEYVGETIDSVLVQRGVDFEVIVIDDASDDGSWDVIASYGDRIRSVRVAENIGSTAARRLGVAEARGAYVMFLDGDDLIEPDTLSALRAALEDRTDAVAAVPWRKLHREGGEWVARSSGKTAAPPGGDPVRAWLDRWYYPPCSVLWPRALYEATGGWGEMGPWDDRELMVRALLGGAQIVVTAGGGALYRILEAGTSLSSQATESATASRLRALDAIAGEARRRGVFERYREPLGRAYLDLAQSAARPYPGLLLESLRRADGCLGRRPISGSPLHRLLWRTLGLERKARLAMWLGAGGR
jgi:O-antigen biosynthesis protein